MISKNMAKMLEMFEDNDDVQNDLAQLGERRRCRVISSSCFPIHESARPAANNHFAAGFIAVDEEKRIPYDNTIRKKKGMRK